MKNLFKNLMAAVGVLMLVSFGACSGNTNSNDVDGLNGKADNPNGYTEEDCNFLALQITECYDSSDGSEEEMDACLPKEGEERYEEAQYCCQEYGYFSFCEVIPVPDDDPAYSEDDCNFLALQITECYDSSDGSEEEMDACLPKEGEERYEEAQYCCQEYGYLSFCQVIPVPDDDPAYSEDDCNFLALQINECYDSSDGSEEEMDACLPKEGEERYEEAQYCCQEYGYFSFCEVIPVPDDDPAYTEDDCIDLNIEVNECVLMLGPELLSECVPHEGESKYELSQWCCESYDYLGLCEAYN
jgi:hypothetical protein